MMAACEVPSLSLGSPPALPLDYFAISPHGSTQSLGDIGGLYLTHGCSGSTPHYHAALLHLLRALQISLCSVQPVRLCVCVCVCVHAHIIFLSPRPFFFSGALIRITITGMQFESRSPPVA